jgi:hypothetical protein
MRLDDMDGRARWAKTVPGARSRRLVVSLSGPG